MVELMTAMEDYKKKLKNKTLGGAIIVDLVMDGA